MLGLRDLRDVVSEVWQQVEVFLEAEACYSSIDCHAAYLLNTFSGEKVFIHWHR